MEEKRPLAWAIFLCQLFLHNIKVATLLAQNNHRGGDKGLHRQKIMQMVMTITICN
jgi:hypothetical protein